MRLHRGGGVGRGRVFLVNSDLCSLPRSVEVTCGFRVCDLSVWRALGRDVSFFSLIPDIKPLGRITRALKSLGNHQRDGLSMIVNRIAGLHRGFSGHALRRITDHPLIGDDVDDALDRPDAIPVDTCDLATRNCRAHEHAM